MDNPRAEKVAVVNEVRERMEAADGAVLTEYRGLTVAELAQLRRELAAAGGDYKVYKNTLVRLAVVDTPREGVSELLTGPTAIAFVQGDVSAVAKALRDFSRANPNLVVKGGVVGASIMSAADIDILAELPSREALLAQFAGALSAPLQQLAGLVQALPRNLAYGLSALIDQRRAEAPAEEAAPEATAAETAEATAEGEATTETAEAPATETAEAPATETAEAESDVTAEPESEPEADAAPAGE
ncbi:MAG: 50S ribosomal protein L10 [Acidimicrobiales bacterium]|jgi:large subunit ribosomal protein L10